MPRSSEGHAAYLWKGHDLSNNVCEYEDNRLTNEKVIGGKRNFNANGSRRRKPASADGFTNL